MFSFLPFHGPPQRLRRDDGKFVFFFLAFPRRASAVGFAPPFHTRTGKSSFVFFSLYTGFRVVLERVYRTPFSSPNGASPRDFS